jgi:hypothetical protein
MGLTSGVEHFRQQYDGLSWNTDTTSLGSVLAYTILFRLGIMMEAMWLEVSS